jgi:flagellar biosynthesis GTPase FlhF
MDETVTLETLLIAGAPAAVVLLILLYVEVASGAIRDAVRRTLGRPTSVQEVEQRVHQLEIALKRARASELPLEIEAERFAREMAVEARRHQAPLGAGSESGEAAGGGAAADTSEAWRAAGGYEKPAVTVTAIAPEVPFEGGSGARFGQVFGSGSGGSAGGSGDGVLTDRSTMPPATSEELVLPPDPDESDEDRVAREQLETEERERIEQLAAEEARIRQEREEAERRTRERVEAEARRREAERADRERVERERQEEEARVERERLEAEAAQRREAERLERERLEAEAAQRREEERRRKAEEFRRRVAEATPQIVMSAGGSNRESVTVNVEIVNNLTPKRAELVLLSGSWARDSSPATFESRRKDGLFEERWQKHPRVGSEPEWGVYEDAGGRVFECPEDPPTGEFAWIVISYDRTVGGAASTWQRFEVGGAGALWYVRQAVGEPVVIEARRDAGQEDEAAA